jgi:hypothetical protein
MHLANPGRPNRQPFVSDVSQIAGSKHAYRRATNDARTSARTGKMLTDHPRIMSVL